ncbi:MAG: hypothetical protein COT74_09425 [Bdellovibrionales bacterium CG10_big_fil_rev_8_21_14_0_10_45_34]|nr:MAG: hypothetical protein COT74_09425 [Bdellovibrionales bacterium CG10_big_fil_rev_8_21_14_0_10_45_34]
MIPPIFKTFFKLLKTNSIKNQKPFFVQLQTLSKKPDIAWLSCTNSQKSNLSYFGDYLSILNEILAPHRLKS